MFCGPTIFLVMSPNTICVKNNVSILTYQLGKKNSQRSIARKNIVHSVLSNWVHDGNGKCCPINSYEKNVIAGKSDHQQQNNNNNIMGTIVREVSK